MFHTIITPSSLCIIREVMNRAIINASIYSTATDDFILEMKVAYQQIDLEYLARNSLLKKEIENLNVFKNKEL